MSNDAESDPPSGPDWSMFQMVGLNTALMFGAWFIVDLLYVKYGVRGLEGVLLGIALCSSYYFSGGRPVGVRLLRTALSVVVAVPLTAFLIYVIGMHFHLAIGGQF